MTAMIQRAEAVGLAVGVLLGSAYAFLQIRSLRRQDADRREGRLPALGAQFGTAALRLALLVVALLAVVMVPSTQLNRWWLTVSLLVFYSLPLFWQLRRMTASKR